MSETTSDNSDAAPESVEESSRDKALLVAAALAIVTVFVVFVVHRLNYLSDQNISISPKGWLALVLLFPVAWTGFKIERKIYRSKASITIENGLVEVSYLNQQQYFRTTDLKSMLQLTFLSGTRGTLHGMSWQQLVVFVSKEGKSLAVSYVADFNGPAHFQALAEKFGVPFEKLEGDPLGQRELNALVPSAGDQAAKPPINVRKSVVVALPAIALLLLVGLLISVPLESINL